MLEASAIAHENRVAVVVEASLPSRCGDFSPQRSDVDFLVVYPEGFDYGPWGSRVDELRERLEQLLGRDVDLVVLRWVDNPYIRRSIERQRTSLYAR